VSPQPSNKTPQSSGGLLENDRIVVLMGPTGAGKSTFINYATKQDGSGVGHGLKSVTTEIRAVRCQHPDGKGTVVFVDTPGFDDTYRSDIDVLSQIAGWFVKVYKERVPLSAIIYLHRITDNRMAGSPLKNLQMFASMCGQKALPGVALVTTMWSDIQVPMGEQRETQLKEAFWKDMMDQGCKVERFGDSYDSAWKVIGELPPPDKNNVLLADELVNENKTLESTAAGLELNKQLAKLLEDQKKAARQIEEQARGKNDPLVVEELKRRKDETENKIAGVVDQLQKLKVPFMKRFTSFFTGRKARKTGIQIPGDSSSAVNVK